MSRVQREAFAVLHVCASAAACLLADCSPPLCPPSRQLQVMGFTAKMQAAEIEKAALEAEILVGAAPGMDSPPPLTAP